MRFPIPLVIELDDEQLKQLAELADWPQVDGQVRAKDAVEGMRIVVVGAIGLHFSELGVRADVSVKR